MNGLDELVRQATALTAADQGLLADSELRQDIFDDTVTGGRFEPAAAPSRSRLVAVAIAAAAAGVVATVTVTHLTAGADTRPAKATITTFTTNATTAPSTALTADPFTVWASCVRSATDTELAKVAFAFDGEVVAINPGPATPLAGARVTFRVNHWYRGGDARTVTVTLVAPVPPNSVLGPVYTVGSRILVSGGRTDLPTDPNDWVAAACGFTKLYSDAEANRWQSVFA